MTDDAPARALADDAPTRSLADDAPTRSLADGSSITGSPGSGPPGSGSSGSGASRPPSPTIAVEGLSVSFDDLAVLSEVDLAVDEGSLVGLVGPNGSGKTTLLRTIRGTLSPDAGTVRVAGERIHGLSARRAGRLVASVPQSTTLSFDFTVEQVVEMGRTPHLGRFEGLGADDRRAIQAAMERTQVAEFADRPITSVSGGERQRVLLARALAQETPVLLLDEPTANLDVNHAVRTLELAADLVAEGKTVLAAIHDLNLAARYCDELALLADGTVRAAGPPSRVLTSKRLRDTFHAETLVTSQPTADAPLVTALADREAADGRVRGTPDGRIRVADCRVHVVGTGTPAARAIGQLVAAGATVSLGVVPEGDAAAERAGELDCEAVTVSPFAGVDDRSRRRAVELARRADVVVAVGDPASENEAILEAAGRTVAVGPEGEVDVIDAVRSSIA